MLALIMLALSDSRQSVLIIVVARGPRTQTLRTPPTRRAGRYTSLKGVKDFVFCASVWVGVWVCACVCVFVLVCVCVREC